MTEFTNVDNTGGYIIPDDAVPIFAPIFASEGFFPVEDAARIGSTAGMGFTANDAVFERFMKDAQERVARFMMLEEARFLGEPQCAPLNVFNTPNPSGEPVRDIKVADIISLLEKTKGTYFFDASDDEPQPIIVEAK